MATLNRSSRGGLCGCTTAATKHFLRGNCPSALLLLVYLLSTAAIKADAATGAASWFSKHGDARRRLADGLTKSPKLAGEEGMSEGVVGILKESEEDAGGAGEQNGSPGSRQQLVQGGKEGGGDLGDWVVAGPPPPPWGPHGINDPDDFLDSAVFVDDRPDTDEYLREVKKWSKRVPVVTYTNENTKPCATRRTAKKSNVGVKIKFMGEFGYELMVVLPFAYFHFLNGTLASTVSCGDPSVATLYWFSENHSHDSSCVRDDYKNLLKPYGWRRGLHKSKIPVAWYPPPLAVHFREWGRVWQDVPAGGRLVVITNKLSNEWNKGPINFLDISILRTILHRFLNAGYFVVYNRPGNAIAEDQWQAVDNRALRLDDYKVVRKLYLKEEYKGRILLMQDIHQLNPGLSFNEVQLRMMARSRCFMSVQGGNSILASYFGGTNIIFARKGFELDFQAYHKTYHRLSGAKIFVARNHYRLRKHVNALISSDQCESI